LGPVVDSAADGCGAYGGCADAPTHIGSAMIDTTMAASMVDPACMVDAAYAATATATASR
jgi:hypothetical protein